MRPSTRCLPRALFTSVLIAISCVLLSCGGNGRVLQSVSVSPASATSQAQFTAIGTYNTMPATADITSTTTWCVGQSNGLCDGDIAVRVQLVAGAAKCLQGANGSFTILAGQSANMPGINQGFTLKPYGAAQITCP
jgi:hypothetical protein